MATKKWKQSYTSRRNVCNVWNYDRLNKKVLSCKSTTVNFLLEKGVLKEEQFCKKCGGRMTRSKCPAALFVEETHFRCQRSHFDEAKNCE